MGGMEGNIVTFCVEYLSETGGVVDRSEKRESNKGNSIALRVAWHTPGSGSHIGGHKIRKPYDTATI